MIKKQIFRIFIYLIGVVGLLLATQRCSPERDEYSFPPMIYDEQAYLREIEAADDLITLNVTRSNYAVALKKSEAVTRALNEKWALLAEEADAKGNIIGKLCDEAELIAFDFEKIGPDRYRLYFLFRVLREFRSNYGIYIAGRLADPSLFPEAYREKGYMRWHFKPLPPTEFWQPGEYVVISSDIIAPDLPFNLRMNFDSPQGRHGNQIPLGIMRKLGQLALDHEAFLLEEDPFQFWEWLQTSHARSGPGGDLVLRRFREVTGALARGAVVEEGIEYYGARISRLGPSRCHLRLLFRCVRPLDHDYRILLYGSVSPENREFLSDSRKKAGKKSEKWSFQIFPPTSTWKPGDFIIISHNFEVKPISYDFFAFIYNRGDGKTGLRFEVGILDSPGP